MAGVGVEGGACGAIAVATAASVGVAAGVVVRVATLVAVLVGAVVAVAAIDVGGGGSVFVAVGCAAGSRKVLNARSVIDVLLCPGAYQSTPGGAPRHAICPGACATSMTYAVLAETVRGTGKSACM
jgi:hypothetical protein